MNSQKWIGVTFVFFVAYIIIAVNLKWDMGWACWIGHIPFGDKICHFLMIGTLTYFVNILFNAKRVTIGFQSVLLGSICVFTFISFEELSQYFLAHRNCEVLDMMANYLGIYVFSRFVPTKKRNRITI